MKKVLFLSCLLWTAVGFGQIDLSTANGNGEWRVGGTAGLNFGNNNYFGVSVAPFVGYRVFFLFGAGGNGRLPLCQE